MLLVVLLWLVVYPLVLVLLEGLRDPAGWTLGYVAAVPRRPTEWQALWASLWISLATVVLAAAIGVPLAFLFARYEFRAARAAARWSRCRRCCRRWSACWRFCFSTARAASSRCWCSGSSASPSRRGGCRGRAPSCSSTPTRCTSTSICSPGRGSRRSTASLYEAAASLGAGRWRTLRRVVLPLLAPALGGAALLTFMTSLASFSAPYIFGGGFRVMTTQIVATRLNGDNRLAMVETVALTVLALAALWLFRGARPVDGGGRRTEGRRSRAPRGAEPARCGCSLTVAGWGLAALLLLPHLTLLLVSFVPLGTWTTEPVPPAYTSRNYLTLLQDPVRARPLAQQPLARDRRDHRRRGHRAGAGLSWPAGAASAAGAPSRPCSRCPWAVPGTVFAIALATAFSVHAPWAGRFVLVGTVWILPLAYLVRNLPITSRAILAGVPRPGSLARRGRRHARGRPMAHPAPGHAAAPPAGARWPGRASRSSRRSATS